MPDIDNDTEERIEDLENNINQLETRIENIEEKLKQINKKVIKHEAQKDDLQMSIEDLKRITRNTATHVELMNTELKKMRGL